jgi:hypothetical protein
MGLKRPQSEANHLLQRLRMSQTTSQLPHMPSRLVQGQIWAYFVIQSVFFSVRDIIGDYPKCHS